MRRWRRGGFALLLAAAAGAVVAAGDRWADVPVHTPAAPQDGALRFAAEQWPAPAALAAWLAAPPRARSGADAAALQELRGHLLLSWGLLDEAEAVFANMPGAANGVAASQRDRGWYLLALARQQQGETAAAGRALARVAGPRQPAQQLLQADLLVARGEPVAAAALLEGVESVAGDDRSARLARYNRANLLLGVADAPAQRARALALLDALGRQGADDEEQRSLRDRANLTLGLAALRDLQPREARAALQRVRLNGSQSDAALLAYGWAAMGLNDPQLALVPWQDLAARRHWSAAVQEARLAVPHALAESGAYAAALQGYRDAGAACARDIAELDAGMAAVRDGRLASLLLDAHAAIDKPDAPVWLQALRPTIAGAPFHAGLQQLRQLRAATQDAERSLQALDVFDDALAQRSRAYEALPQALAQRDAAAVAALQAQREALAGELSRASRDGDGRAYADAAEQRMTSGLQREGAALRALQREAEALADSGGIGAIEGIDTLAARLRRVEGAFVWRLAQALPARELAARTSLREADLALAQAQARAGALADAQRDERPRLAEQAARSAALRLRLLAVAPQAQALADEQQHLLQALAEEALKRQQDRLRIYAAHALGGVAQTLDSAQFARPVPAGAPGAATR